MLLGCGGGGGGGGVGWGEEGNLGRSTNFLNKEAKVKFMFCFGGVGRCDELFNEPTSISTADKVTLAPTKAASTLDFSRVKVCMI